MPRTVTVGLPCFASAWSCDFTSRTCAGAWKCCVPPALEQHPPLQRVHGRTQVAAAGRTRFPEHGASPRVRIRADDGRRSCALSPRVRGKVCGIIGMFAETGLAGGAIEGGGHAPISPLPVHCRMQPGTDRLVERICLSRPVRTLTILDCIGLNVGSSGRESQAKIRIREGSMGGSRKSRAPPVRVAGGRGPVRHDGRGPGRRR